MSYKPLENVTIVFSTANITVCADEWGDLYYTTEIPDEFVNQGEPYPRSKCKPIIDLPPEQFDRVLAIYKELPDDLLVLNELIQSFEKKEEYNRKLEELEEEIKEFSSQNQTLVEDCKSTIREIELEHQKTIQSLSRCSQSLYNEANAVLKNTHDLMIINGLLSERIQTLLKYATTSLEPEQESKLIEEITSAINHIKMENEQIAHHRQELEKAMRDIEQHDLEVAQKQELKEIQGHHFGGLSI